MSVVRRWNIKRWNYTNIDAMPDYVGVYEILNSSETVNYVGSTNQLRRRLLEHWNQRDIPGAYYFRAYQCNSRQNATSEERRLIRRYNPPYNA